MRNCRGYHSKRDTGLNIQLERFSHSLVVLNSVEERVQSQPETKNGFQSSTYCTYMVSEG